MRPLSSALGMKIDGGTLPRVRMVPPGEGLDGDDPLVREGHDRLVGERQVLVLDGLAQVGLELHSRGDLGLHRRLEQRIRAAAADLGAVHRDVGVAQQVVRRAVAAGGDDDADAARIVIWRSSCSNGASNAAGSARPARAPPPASRRPRRRSRTRRRRGGRSCPRVAAMARSRWATAVRSSSPAVWPRLSLIVLKRSRSRNSSPTRPGSRDRRVERVLQPVLEQGAVGQPGQVVVERLDDEALLERAALGDVGQRAGHADELARIVVDRSGMDLDPDRRSRRGPTSRSSRRYSSTLPRRRAGPGRHDAGGRPGG